MKSVPFTVRRNAGPAELTVVGLMLVSTGAFGGAITVSVEPADVHPLGTHGAGLMTVMFGVAPCTATSLDSTVTASDVGLLNVVARFAPSSCTTTPGTKPVPRTVSVKFALPAAMLAGLSAEITGVSLA